MSNSQRILLYPRYISENTYKLEEFCDKLSDGTIDEFVMSQYARFNELPLGRFSMNLTTPYNGYEVVIMVDLNVIKNETPIDIYKLRIEHVDSDAFIDVDSDIVSVQNTIYAIISGTVHPPLISSTGDDIIMYEGVQESAVTQS